MPDKNNRKKLGTVTRYQTQILLLTFLPTLVLFLCVSGLLTICYKSLIDVIINYSAAESVRIIWKWGALIMGLIWAGFIVLVIWSYYVSHSLVGPFQRIIRELDEIIEGKHKRKIIARQKDLLAKDLLKRINVLIERLP